MPFLLFVVSGTVLRAQIESFNITVRNLTQTGSKTIEFDVYLQNTDQTRDFELANCQLGFLVNSLIYSGGNLSAKIDNSRSDLESYQQYTAKPSVESKLSGYPDQTLVRLAQTPNITRLGTIISKKAPGTLLTHFILTSSVDFTINSTPNLIFISSSESSPLYPTKVSEYLYFGTYKYKRQLTVTPGENAIVYGNPVLNPVSLPEAFKVTGTGSYCRGVAEGLPVGLSGSEKGVKYTLYRDGLALEPSVEGTGSEISFGIKPPGTYTATGMNKAGITQMKGSAVITENPEPTAPVIGTITQPTCESSTGSVEISGLPEEGTWTLVRQPGDVKIEGSGNTITVTELYPETYGFIVINSFGCISVSSDNVIINDQPPVPSVPVISTDCSLGAGKAVVTIVSPLGNDLQYRLDNGIFQSAPSFKGVANGNHTVTVRNSFGCTVTGSPFLVECGCANPAFLTLGSNSGSTCGTAMVTVSNNRFGGSATSVTIIENGAGSVIPVSTSTTPFDFVYIPAQSDIGKTVIIKVTTDNPDGPPCEPATAIYTLTVSEIPSAPVTGNIIHPTCFISTGSVVISGLPAAGTWELIRSPDNIIITGTGTILTVAGLNPGTYTFKVKNSNGCISESSASVVINQQPQTPAAPLPGTITQPACEVSTGSVILNGLPSSGTWTVRGNPGGITKSGSGTSTTISNLTANTYTFTVANADGCTSQPSSGIVIQNPPEIPSAPVVGAITSPTCTVSTGGVMLSGLPSSGTWTLTRYPGSVKITGTGTTRNITGLQPGTYYFTVTGASGCTSPQSVNVIIPVQPPTPSAPVVGLITQPTYTVPTGSVVLSGLPSGITWRLIRNPGGIILTGTGTSVTVAGLEPGTYTFAVINTYNCTSPYTPGIVIHEQPQPLNLIINDPPTICSTSTVDLTSPSITAGSDERLTFSYWIDKDATMPLHNPTQVSEGTYYIKGTLTVGSNTDFYDIKPVNVTADQMPVADAGPDQVLIYTFKTYLDALPVEYGKGEWSVGAGSGIFQNTRDPKSLLTNLSFGRNDFIWTVKNGVCPDATDKVIIIVEDLVIPTLITPDMDGRNDYFILRGLGELGKTELVIFDRRGAKVYWNKDYNNTWNGVDYKGNPLPSDTYFYVMKSESGKSMSGFVVLRR